MEILAIDVGTTETGWCLLTDKYEILDFGKDTNEYVLNIAKSGCYEILVYEGFASYGMPIGKTTIEAIQWNGRFIQTALDLNREVATIYRADEKMNICKSMKANDSTIRQALIDRFAKFDFKNGKGTKNNKDFFYGFAKDCWSAFAVGCTYLDLYKKVV